MRRLLPQEQGLAAALLAACGAGLNSFPCRCAVLFVPFPGAWWLAGEAE